jgi:hypothetical protein
MISNLSQIVMLATMSSVEHLATLQVLHERMQKGRKVRRRIGNKNSDWLVQSLHILLMWGMEFSNGVFGAML